MPRVPEQCGAVAEWSKALAWKVSIRQKRIEGSNPSRSASHPRHPSPSDARPAKAAAVGALMYPNATTCQSSGEFVPLSDPIADGTVRATTTTGGAAEGQSLAD